MSLRIVKPAFVRKWPRQIEMDFNPSRRLLGGRRSTSDFEMLDGDLPLPSVGVIQRA